MVLVAGILMSNPVILPRRPDTRNGEDLWSSGGDLMTNRLPKTRKEIDVEADLRVI
jgi:hypothetical protein